MCDNIGTGVRWFFPTVLALLAACTVIPPDPNPDDGGTSGSDEGCDNDNDCKGDRICVNDECVDPEGSDTSGGGDTSGGSQVDFCCTPPLACEMIETLPEGEECWCQWPNGEFTYGDACSDQDVVWNCCTNQGWCPLPNYATPDEACYCPDAYGAEVWGQTC